jgi:lysozyme
MFSNVAKMIRVRESNPGKVYRDTLGNLTCGWGHLLSPGSIFPDAAAEILFQHDFHDALHVAQQMAPPDLSDVRLAVIVDMAFQMGYVGLKRFELMWEHLRHGNFMGAADEILRSVYAKQTPNRARRNAQMMRTNLWIVEEVV